jgi:DNA-binding NarL/FixJ family response regulator
MGRVLEGGQLRPVNLLVVAEEGLAQRTMLRLIGRTEHRAVSAVGVEEACAALEAGIEIDLVLVDPDGTRTLPEETIARLAASRRDCAVLVLAAYLSPAEEVAVREAGAALIAKKPISAHDLGHAIFAAVAGA